MLYRPERYHDKYRRKQKANVARKIHARRTTSVNAKRLRGEQLFCYIILYKVCSDAVNDKIKRKENLLIIR